MATERTVESSPHSAREGGESYHYQRRQKSFPDPSQEPKVVRKPTSVILAFRCRPNVTREGEVENASTPEGESRGHRGSRSLEVSYH